MIDSGARAALEPILALFDRLSVGYYIGGSLASTAYGEPRSTMDADVIADVKPSHVGEIVTELSGDYYVNAEQIREAVRRKSCFNLVSLVTSFKVDVFVRKERALSESEFRRRQRIQIGAEPELFAWFASAEDTLLSKLEWYRRGGEPRSSVSEAVGGAARRRRSPGEGRGCGPSVGIGLTAC